SVRAVFFFQAEDGIRDFHVTGVQTCALPISAKSDGPSPAPTSTPCTGNCARGGVQCCACHQSQPEATSAPSSNAAAMRHRHENRSEERRVGKECRTSVTTTDAK